MINLNSRILDYLQSVEISHLFAKDYKHGIETRGHWDMFEPTRFVYAYFAFNMLYAIDWNLSMEKNKLIYQKKGNDNFTKVQIQSVIDFVFLNDCNAFENALLLLDSNRELFKVVSTMEYDYNSSKDSSRNNKSTIVQEFINASEKFSNEITLNSDDHFDLLQMSYTVRNNLFHGEKKAHQMKEKGHRKRLLHYGNILLATNECFFEVMKNKYRYRRMEEWEVDDNVR